MKWLLGTALLALASLAACNKSNNDGVCTKDADCGQGQVCQNWKCGPRYILRGGIGTVGLAPETTGNVRLIEQGLTIGGSACNASVCLKNGGISP